MKPRIMGWITQLAAVSAVVLCSEVGGWAICQSNQASNPQAVSAGTSCQGVPCESLQDGGCFGSPMQQDYLCYPTATHTAVNTCEASGSGCTVQIKNSLNSTYGRQVPC